MENLTQEQLKVWQNKIDSYKSVYSSMYPGIRPTEKCMKSFCELNGIPWPLPLAEPEEDWSFLE